MTARPGNPGDASGSAPLDQSALKRHAGYLLARARFIAFRTFHEQVGEPHQLKPVEFALLILLGSNLHVTQKQLSRALGVAQPNMTGLLRRLEERGLIARTRGVQDKRLHFIALTAAGTRLLRRASASSQGMDQGWLARLSPAEQAMLMELLEKVTLAAPAPPQGRLRRPAARPA